MSEPSVRRILSIFLAPLLVVVIGWGFETYLNREERHHLRVQTVGELATLRAQLEGAMSRNINLVQGLTTVVISNPDITQQEFGSLGDLIFQQPSQLKNLALAKDMVITHVYPLEGNRKALGLNYRTHPKQSAAARRVVETGAMVVAGPVALVQGGVGFVARAPIYTRDPVTAKQDRFWGLIASVIDAEKIYEASGLGEAKKHLDIALRGKDALGGEGEVFWGDPSLFDQDAVTLEVALPIGSWQLTARPVAGWDSMHSSAWQVRLFTGLIGVSVLILSVLWQRSQEKGREIERRLTHTRATLITALEQMPSGFVLIDAESGQIQMANRAALSMRSLNHEEIIGQTLEKLQQNSPAYHPDGSYFHSSELPLAQALYHGKSSQNVQLVLRWGEPEETWMMVNAAPVNDESGKLIAAFSISSNVTEIKRAEEQIRHRAYFDHLTGLPNRTYFLELLDQAVRQAERHRKSTALLFIDLDRFKNVNDTLGHDVGDLLLKEVAGRLRGNVRTTDTVARLGGDEFTIILTDLALDGHVTVIAEKLIRRLSQPYLLAGHEIFSAASIGITLCPADGSDPQTLLKNADMAMYKAKEKGRNTFRYFTNEMTEKAEAFVTIEKDLRGALDAQELFLEFQPVVHLTTRKLAGFEALVRWTHQERGRVGPDQFIPIAEETGQIVEIGEWVLKKACEEMVELSKAIGHCPSRLSINVSSRQFRGGFDAQVVENILTQTCFPADRLILEITESLLMDEDDRIRRTLYGLRELGVGLSVDDFGTGYSALGYLRRFPATVLKIDKSFISDLGEDVRNTNLVAAIIAMARSLGLLVVAEGVETLEQAQRLEGLSCDYIQGYLLSRPMSLSDLKRYVKEYDSAMSDWGVSLSR